MVIWKTIPEFDGYEASSEGQIRSLDRVLVIMKNGVNRKYHGRVLRPGVHSDEHPYPVYSLIGPDGKRRMYPAHRLVALAFIGPNSLGKQVCHKDGNPENNKYTNLYYGTPLENQADRVMHGTHSRGTQHSQAILSNEDVITIRDRLKRGEKQKDVGKDYGISQSHVSLIKSGKLWGHIGA